MLLVVTSSDTLQNHHGNNKAAACCLPMQILNKEAVDKVRSEREIPDVQPGCMIQIRLVISFLHVLALALFGYVSGTDRSCESMNSKFLRTNGAS